eukprot:TRINITY_DN16956_c0_g1_i2.p1 TRINITY_DN16956_c0_g1~~TRINITY_DN16956_c0_g1_i2.p1  ORF type:complete len:310 (+),score=30.61 TRINITY_DN16956_c0_g1_i2:60-989(+)
MIGFFFFFKQKTAYEIMPSLVGSEMCIRDRLKDYAQSVKYYQLFIQTRDSLWKNELNSALDSIKVQFKTEQVNRENSSLTEQTKMQNKTISLQRIIMLGSFLLVALLILFAFAIIHNRRKMNKSNILLGLKNADISSKAEQLKTANNKLMELSEFKDSMNSFLVHDLKNPLNTIINIDPRNNSIQQTETIKRSGIQMLHLVMNMLDVSKYENKIMKIATQDTSVTQIINNAYSNIKYPAGQKNISFKSNIISDFMVKADTEIIERVLVNLFTNAIKYSVNGKSIEVNAECIDNYHLKIIIKDNGPCTLR